MTWPGIPVGDATLRHRPESYEAFALCNVCPSLPASLQPRSRHSRSALSTQAPRSCHTPFASRRPMTPSSRPTRQSAASRTLACCPAPSTGRLVALDQPSRFTQSRQRTSTASLARRRSTRPVLSYPSTLCKAFVFQRPGNISRNIALCLVLQSPRLVNCRPPAEWTRTSPINYREEL